MDGPTSLCNNYRLLCTSQRGEMAAKKNRAAAYKAPNIVFWLCVNGAWLPWWMGVWKLGCHSHTLSYLLVNVICFCLFPLHGCPPPPPPLWLYVIFRVPKKQHAVAPALYRRPFPSKLEPTTSHHLHARRFPLNRYFSPNFTDDVAPNP